LSKLEAVGLEGARKRAVVEALRGVGVESSSSALVQGRAHLQTILERSRSSGGLSLGHGDFNEHTDVVDVARDGVFDCQRAVVDLSV